MKVSPVEFVKKIVRIPSVNPPGNERPVAEAIQALLDEYGIENQLMPFDEGRANLVAWIRGNSSQPTRRVLGLSGHMDVVPPGQIKWTHDPFSAEEVDGKIYGRGTCDMKGGLAALLFAMIALKEEGVPLNGDVKLLATAGEEMASVGAKKLVEAGHMDEVTALLIAEPTKNKIRIAEKGALWVEIITYGKTAHGSSPSLGINAIVHMHEIVDALIHEFKMDHTPDELLGEPTMNIAVIKGGVKTNVVPDRCSIQIDFRTLPSQRHDEILKALHLLLDKVRAKVHELNAEIRVLNDLPPVKTDPNHPFVIQVQKVIEEVYGTKETPRGMSGYTDGAVLVRPDSGVPLVICGPGDTRLAHQPDEYIEIAPFLESITFYKKLIAQYLS